VIDRRIELELSVQQPFWESPAAASFPDPAIATETWESWFASWLALMQAELPSARGYELSVRLSDDGEIRQLNAGYRQQDKPTDVLAFAALEVDSPLAEPFESDDLLYLGDIAISVETAARQAIARGHDLTVELAWLAAHGLLHLLGWDHPDDDSLSRMLAQQETLLHAVGLEI
jgi:probable rRNA maturation factor